MEVCSRTTKNNQIATLHFEQLSMGILRITVPVVLCLFGGNDLPLKHWPMSLIKVYYRLAIVNCIYHMVGLLTQRWECLLKRAA